MRFLKTTIFSLFLLTVVCAQAAYQVEITFVNGAKRVVEELVVQSGKVILAQENLSVPFEQIQSVNFTFEGSLTADECDELLKRAAYGELMSRVTDLLNSVEQGWALPGNIDQYLQYKMRAGFLAGKLDEVQSVIRILQSKNSSYAPLAGLYNVLIMLEKDQPSEAVSAALQATQNPDKISGAIAEYIRGRLAMSSRQYEPALQHFSNVLVFYSRDPEWVPAATFQEALVYKKTGYLESAANIVKELEIAYPNGYWGRRAVELK